MAKVKDMGRRFLFAANLLVWIIFLVVLVIAFTPVTGCMLKPLLIKEEIRKADVIVVLGGGVDRGRYLTLESSHRLVRGGQLYYEGMAPKIVFSGGVSPKAGVAEGAVLAQEARRLKIPSEDIVMEN
jgi:uncharacterized SAM-binding protein YcdF (DUF218 family)